MSFYSEIIVRNQEDNVIAIFSNQNYTEDSVKMMNILVSPTVNVQLNGASTLSFQILKDSEKWNIVKDPMNLWYCEGRVYTALNTGSYQYDGDVVNVTLIETWYLLGKEFCQIHNVDTDIEAMDEHTIKILPKTSTNFKLTVNGVEYDDSEVRDGRGVLLPRGSAGYCLWALLKANSQGWSLGICDVLADGFDPSEDYGVFNLETDMKSILDNIQYVKDFWGGVLIWDSVNKVLNHRDETKTDTQFNAWNGFSVEYGKNMTSEPTVTVDSDIITRAYVLGNGNMHIKEVNDDKTYIENFSYTDRVFEGYIVNPNIYYTGDASHSGPKMLKNWAIGELERLCKPRESYEIGVLDRRKDPAFSHEVFEVGDVIKVFIRNFITGENEEKQLRVIDHTFNVWNRYESVIVVGDKIQNEVELYKHIYDNSIVDNPKFDLEGDFNGEDVKVLYNQNGIYSFADITTIANSQYAEIKLLTQYTTENTDAIAGLRIYSDATFATIESFTTFKNYADDMFTQSDTKINQLSNALSAQIELEAKHHQEALDFTSDSIAGLKLYVDGSFSQAILSAAYSSSKNYTDGEIDDVNDNIAYIELVADRNSSRISIVADDVEIVSDDLRIANGNISAISANLSSLSATVATINNLYVTEVEARNIAASTVESTLNNVGILVANYVAANSFNFNGRDVSRGSGYFINEDGVPEYVRFLEWEP